MTAGNDEERTRLAAAVAASEALANARVRRQIEEEVPRAEARRELRHLIEHRRIELLEADATWAAGRAVTAWLADPTPARLKNAADRAFRARVVGWGFVDERGESEVAMDRIRRWADLVLITSSAAADQQ